MRRENDPLNHPTFTARLETPRSTMIATKALSKSYDIKPVLPGEGEGEEPSVS